MAGEQEAKGGAGKGVGSAEPGCGEPGGAGPFVGGEIAIEGSRPLRGRVDANGPDGDRFERGQTPSS